MRLPAGEGEIDEDLGPTCVRLNTLDSQEVVWAIRLCPARARVISVPLDPGRRFGEVVLHDGVPNGERRTGWGTVAVFDEIELFAPSAVATLTAEVDAHAEADVQALLDSFEEAKWGIETPSDFELLCKCCSEGRVDQERTVNAGSQLVRIAAPRDQARALLESWQAEDPQARSWSDLQTLG